MEKPTTSRFCEVVLVMALSWPTLCFGQVTSNVLLRTLLIAVPGAGAAASVPTGTAFTIDVGGREYLITAKHVVSTLNDGAEGIIAIKTKAGWSREKVTVFKCRDPVDIAVLIPPTQLTIDFPLEASSVPVEVGQDVYFVGFPNGGEHAVTYPNMPYVFGFVKRATLAQFVGVRKSGKQIAREIWLDGINNPGFSGSPVVYRDFSKPGVVFKVAGVIVAYEWNPVPVLRKVEITPSQVTAADRESNDVMRGPDGKLYRLEDTGDFVEQNTGMAVAWDIGSAVELIKKHPFGPKVSDQFQPGD